MEERWLELQERLERTEREVRALRRQAWIGRAVTVALIASGLTFALTRPAATQLRAQAVVQGGTRVVAPLVVVDNQNNPLLQVSAAPGGGGLLAVLDQAGSPIGLRLFDAAGAKIVGAGLAPNARGIRVFDPAEKVVVGLGITADGRGETVYDETEQPILHMGEDPGRSLRGLGVVNAAGKYVAGLTAGPAHGELALASNNGTILFSQP